MQTLYQAITHYAATQPDKLAIVSGLNTLSYAALLKALHQFSSHLPLDSLSKTVAIDLENDQAWAVLDLSMLPHKTVTLPIPPFFSDTQIQHAIQDASAGTVITDKPERYQSILGDKVKQTVNINIVGQTLKLLTIEHATKTLPAGTAKVTYTSGTTGTPKGVCLSCQSMTAVAQSIAKATQLATDNRHVAVLPLATLLENVAGLYANLLAGGTTYLLPTSTVGFTGSQFDIQQLIQTLRDTQANSAILMPGMLAQLVAAYESGIQPLNDLNFLAVGGASVAPDLLRRAKQVGLPVYEGYGLSESNSVVALNTRATTKIGSVGKPLPHVQVKVGANNELFAKGANHLGYIGHPPPTDEWLPTGDIGYQDDEGYLFINGRKSNMFITAYGRNVSPEWIERDLTNTAPILQACVFGEGKPWNMALIVASSKTNTNTIELAISSVNQHLPEYARIHQWVLADGPFTVKNEQLTPNGRLKRDQIWTHYQPIIDARYTQEALTA